MPRRPWPWAEATPPEREQREQREQRAESREQRAESRQSREQRQKINDKQQAGLKRENMLKITGWFRERANACVILREKRAILIFKIIE
jgi:hypothetical protein